MSLILAGIVLVVALLLVLLPVFWLFIGPSLEKGSFSFGFILASWAPMRLRSALQNTLLASVLASAGATALGTLFALLVVRTDMPARRTASILIAGALVTSSYLMAFAYVVLLGPNAGLVNDAIKQLFGIKHAVFDIYTFQGYVFVATLEGVPLVFLTCSSALRNLDGSFESAARIIGAGPLRVVTTVTLPLILPAVGAGALLVFIYTLSLYGAPQVLGIRVVPTEIQALFSYPPRLDLAAGISIILMVPALLALLLYRFIARRGERFVTVGGKWGRPEPFLLGRARWVALGAVAIYALLALALPYAVLMVASLSVAVGNGFRPENFTLANFAYVFSDSLTVRALCNSLLIAAVSAAAATLAAAVIALVQVRARRSVGLAIADAIYMLPFGIPSIIIAVGVILAFIRPPLMLYGTLAIICIAMFVKFLPIAIRALVPVFTQIDRSLEDASRITGASLFSTYTRITLPLAWSGIATAAVLVFIPTFRDLGASMLLTSPFNETIAFAMITAWGGVSFEVTCAIGVVMFVVTMMLQLAIAQLSRLGSRGPR